MSNDLLQPSKTPSAPRLQQASSTPSSNPTSPLNWRAALKRIGSTSSRLASRLQQTPPPPLIMVSPPSSTLLDKSSQGQALPLSGLDFSNVKLAPAAEITPLISAEQALEQAPKSESKTLADDPQQQEDISFITDVLIHLADLRATFDANSRASLLEYKKIAHLTMEQVDRIHQKMGSVRKHVKNVDVELDQLKTQAADNTTAIESLDATIGTLTQTMPQAFNGLQEAVLDGLEPLRLDVQMMQEDIATLQQTVHQLSLHISNIQRQLQPAQQSLISLQKVTRHTANEVFHLQQQAIQTKQDLLGLPNLLAKDVATATAQYTSQSLQTVQAYSESTLQEMEALQRTSKTHGQQLRTMGTDISLLHSDVRFLIDALLKSARSSRPKRSRESPKDTVDTSVDQGVDLQAASPRSPNHKRRRRMSEKESNFNSRAHPLNKQSSTATVQGPTPLSHVSSHSQTMVHTIASPPRLRWKSQYKADLAKACNDTISE